MDDPRQEMMAMEDRVKSARSLVKNTMQQIMLKTGLPPYLMDLIVCEALADIRNFEIHWGEELPRRPAPTENREGDENAVGEN